MPLRATIATTAFRHSPCAIGLSEFDTGFSKRGKLLSDRPATLAFRASASLTLARLRSCDDQRHDEASRSPYADPRAAQERTQNIRRNDLRDRQRRRRRRSTWL